MNIPFTLDKIKQHPRDLLLLTYYQFNMCTSSIVNYGTGETPTCFVYPSKEYDEVAVRRALRDGSGLSADTIYRHYNNIAVREVVQSQTFALLSKEQFEKIYYYLEKDFPDYQKRNQMFRVLIYMYVQCCNFTPYTESLSNMAAELEINRNGMSCGIRYAVYRHGIGYTRKAFYDGKTRQASSYQFYKEMVPEDLQDNLGYRKHILTRKPTPEEEQYNLDLLARYASHSVYENYPKDYIVELFSREG